MDIVTCIWLPEDLPCLGLVLDLGTEVTRQLTIGSVIRVCMDVQSFKGVCGCICTGEVTSVLGCVQGQVQKAPIHTDELCALE